MGTTIRSSVAVPADATFAEISTVLQQLDARGRATLRPDDCRIDFAFMPAELDELRVDSWIYDLMAETVTVPRELAIDGVDHVFRTNIEWLEIEGMLRVAGFPSPETPSIERAGLLSPADAAAMRAAGRAACEEDGSWVHSAVGDAVDPNGDDTECYARTAEALRGYAAALLDEANEIDARVRRGRELGTMCAACGDPEGVQCCEEAPIPYGPAALAAREAVAA